MATPLQALKIAHVDAETGFSGGEVQVFLLLEGLTRRGHDCTLYCPPESRSEERARELGLRTRAVRMRNDLDLPAVAALSRAFRRDAVDLVHLHTGRAAWLGGLAACRAGRPAVATRRMDRRVRRGPRTRLLYGRLLSRVAAISPAVARCLEEGGVDRGRIRTIPSAVDPGALAPRRERAAVRRELGLEPGDPAVLCLASLVPRKGIDVLIEALARGRAALAEAVLLVAGDGPEAGPLAELARRRGVAARVRLLGPRADAPDLLSACDLFALPSRREGLGVAALEAMAAGRAVVASRVGGLAEAVVDGRTGRLVPPGDPAALAEALEELLGDDALRGRLAAAGPERVREGFLAEQMVASYEELYREVLS